jgi:CRISPR system Cascade subunit CasE
VKQMPYLSRIWLNPFRTGAQRMLNNPQVLHAAVLQGLSDATGERVLWRLDTDNPRRAAVLVLTNRHPSWEHLVEQAGWPSADEPQALVRAYEPLLAQIAHGREFAFRLRANPVSSTRHPANPSVAQKEKLAASARPRGVRVPHRTAKHQLGWFLDRTHRWGFDIPTTGTDQPDVLLTARQRLDFTKPTPENGRRRVIIETATFEGKLRVHDPDTFRHSLLTGVGSARAYGCGLITLAPLSGG